MIHADDLRTARLDEWLLRWQARGRCPATVLDELPLGAAMKLKTHVKAGPIIINKGSH
jgi:hypothetical protein